MSKHAARTRPFTARPGTPRIAAERRPARHSSVGAGQFIYNGWCCHIILRYCWVCSHVPGVMRRALLLLLLVVVVEVLYNEVWCCLVYTQYKTLTTTYVMMPCHCLIPFRSSFYLRQPPTRGSSSSSLRPSVKKTRTMVHVFVAVPDGVRGKDVTCTFHRSSVELVARSRDSSIEPSSTHTAITAAASNANRTEWKVRIFKNHNCQSTVVVLFQLWVNDRVAMNQCCISSCAQQCAALASCFACVCVCVLFLFNTR